MRKKYGPQVERRKIFKELLNRQGCICSVCNTTETKTGVKYASMDLTTLRQNLVLHSEAVDETKLTINDFKLICKSCNNSKSRKKTVKSLKDIQERTNIYKHKKKERLNYVTQSQKKNVDGKPRFERWLYDKITKAGAWEYEDVLNAGAMASRDKKGKNGVEPECIEKWLKPLLSSEGPYEVKTVMLDDKPVSCIRFKVNKELEKKFNN